VRVAAADHPTDAARAARERAPAFRNTQLSLLRHPGVRLTAPPLFRDQGGVVVQNALAPSAAAHVAQVVLLGPCRDACKCCATHERVSKI
jgi:hypothetical protein